jgi:hypothetical protein
MFDANKFSSTTGKIFGFRSDDTFGADTVTANFSSLKNSNFI